MKRFQKDIPLGLGAIKHILHLEYEIVQQIYIQTEGHFPLSIVISIRFKGIIHLLSNIQTLLSLEQVASKVPDESQATLLTSFSWPSKVWIS